MAHSTFGMTKLRVLHFTLS